MTAPLLPPVIVRAPLFASRSEAALKSYFSAVSDHGYPALRIFIHSAEAELFQAGGVEFYHPRINRFQPALKSAEDSPCPNLFKDLALSLQEDPQICEVLCDVDDIDMFESQFGNYQLVMFPGCAVLSVADPAGWQDSPKARALRCSQPLVARAMQGVLLLGDVSSNHARASQVSKVLSALEVWQAMTPLAISKEGELRRSVFDVPRQISILKCEASSISEALQSEKAMTQAT